MNEYLIVWLDHTSTIIRGSDIGVAFVEGGYTAYDFLKIDNHYDLNPKEGESFKNKLAELANVKI